MTAALVNFRQLINLAFPRTVLSWIAGEQNVDPQIHWITTTLDEVVAGDVYLHVVSPMGVHNMEIAARRGAAGIIVIGNSPLDLGDKLFKLPIVSVITDESVREVEKTLFDVLFNERTCMFERGFRIHTQLAQLSAEFAGLSGLVQAMVEISGRGVFVQDKRGHILADQPSMELVHTWHDVLVDLGSFHQLPELLQNRELAGKQTTPLVQKLAGGLIRLVSPIAVKGVARGYLSFIGISEDVEPWDYMVAEQGVLICAIEMARHKAVREMEKQLQGDLLTALLNDDFSPRDASLWAQTMGLDLSQAHVALRFAWGKQKTPSRRRLETMIHGEILHSGLKVISNAMGAEVICFCEIPLGLNRPDPVIDLGEMVLQQGRLEQPDQRVLCGIGTQALDLSEWRTSFRQAGQALEMARRLDSAKALYFPDLSIYRLLFQIEHSQELMKFQTEILGALLAQENSQELINTLESYFAHNGNISQTAEALFVHRNTLIYRLERIAVILNQDLEKPETRLALQLALHINRMSSTEA